MLIENRETRVYIVGEVKLMPGVNQISKNEWNHVKGHPHVMHRLDDELLKVIDQEDAADGEVHSIKEFQPKQAEKIIKQTFDEKLLNDWLADEKRGSVKAAISAQLKFVSVGAKNNTEETQTFKA